MPNQIDLGSMSLEEISALKEELTSRETELRTAKLIELRERWKAEALAAGLTVDEVLGIPETSAKRMPRDKSVSPKYRNPDDPSVTWTGRGRRPEWVRVFLSSGGQMDQLKIS